METLKKELRTAELSVGSPAVVKNVDFFIINQKINRPPDRLN